MTKQFIYGLAVACVAIFVAPVSAELIVAENFGGDNSPLNGTTADTFDAAITSAGGSNTWGAHPTFIQSDGDVDSANNDGAAFLTLGTYIEDAKGTATGLFTLAATLSKPTGPWVSLGFWDSNPSATDAFSTGPDSFGHIIYRGAGSNNGELDMYGGAATANGVDGPNGQTGDQLLTTVLDLTTHDGVTDFGTVTWYQGTAAPGNLLGSHAYTVDHTFGAIGFSLASNTEGHVAGLTLTAVPEPATMSVLALGVLGVLARRKRRA